MLIRVVVLVPDSVPSSMLLLGVMCATRLDGGGRDCAESVEELVSWRFRLMVGTACSGGDSDRPRLLKFPRETASITSSMCRDTSSLLVR